VPSTYAGGRVWVRHVGLATALMGGGGVACGGRGKAGEVLHFGAA